MVSWHTPRILQHFLLRGGRGIVRDDSLPNAGYHPVTVLHSSAPRYLIDSRLFRRLCSPGETTETPAGTALEGFRESLDRHGLTVAGRLPPLELTPLAFLDALGVQPAPYDVFALPPSVLRKSKENLTLTSLLAKMAKDFYAKAEELQPQSLRKRVEDMRERTAPAAHELFDHCLTCFVSKDGFEDSIQGHLAFDYLYRFKFPEAVREDIFDFLAASLFAAGESVSGLSKVRIIQALWGRSYERLLKRNPGARADVQALDREMVLKTFKDFLAWEVLHHSILGYGGKKVQPVTAFTPDPEETVKTRTSAYKSALRAFLDQINEEELATTLRPPLQAWQPGVLVPVREDGTFDVLIRTGDLPVF